MLRKNIDFRAIKDKLDLREVARNNGIKINNRGLACCPFHDDKTPSMRIDKEHFYCFGCQEKGDVFDFVGKLNGLNFMSTVEYLNKEYRLGLGGRLSRREKREIEEEKKLRQADKEYKQKRKETTAQIANHYIDELRELNGLVGQSERDTKLLQGRINVLNDILDKYAEGKWDELIFFNEKDRFSEGNYLESKSINYGQRT